MSKAGELPLSFSPPRDLHGLFNFSPFTPRQLGFSSFIFFLFLWKSWLLRLLISLGILLLRFFATICILLLFRVCFVLRELQCRGAMGFGFTGWARTVALPDRGWPCLLNDYLWVSDLLNLTLNNADLSVIIVSGNRWSCLGIEKSIWVSGYLNHLWINFHLLPKIT